jgi:ribokinase
MRYVAGRTAHRGLLREMEDGLLRRHDHAIESLRGALKSLRTRNGLTVERLRATGLHLDPLLDLDVVRQLERTQELSPEEAIVAAVRGAAAQLDVADMLIADAALALGLLTGSRFDRRDGPGGPDGPDGPHGLDVSGLYAADLSDRRDFLVGAWGPLHEAVGARTATPAPTVRALRTELESRAFERVAERILTASPLDAAAGDEPAQTTPQAHDRPGRSGAPAGRGAPHVLIVGAAVLDHIFAVEHVPEVGTAVQATSYESLPGGKGLNQAVAAARLGMDAQLLATLGDDEAGNRLLTYLEREGVNTDLVRMVPGATTPVTSILVTADGTPSTTGWMNEAQIGLTVRDVRSRAVRAAVDQADAVLLTFEPPRDTVESVLELAGGPRGGPTVLLTPSPPDASARFAHESLRYVDYLIGTHWELSCLLPATGADASVEELSTQLLVLGAGTVCVAEEFGCTVRSNELAFDVPGVPTGFHEAPGARDAFAAALALRLHESEDRLGADDASWATAAMAALQTFGGVARSMPPREEVDRILKLASSGTGDSVDR